MKTNSQINQMLKDKDKKIFNLKEITRKKKSEITWANKSSTKLRL
jgi:hypothetical protein